MLIDKIESIKNELAGIGYKYKTSESQSARKHYEFYAQTLIDSVIEEERLKLKSYWDNLKYNKVNPFIPSCREGLE